MQRIVEFVLYDNPIDIENLRKSLHHQVERASIRLKGIQNILTLLHRDHLIPSVRYSLLSGWLGLLQRTVSEWWVHLAISVPF
jgi:E3 ubiquitin-protein ligase HERC2